jgi:hypothetical protein
VGQGEGSSALAFGYAVALANIREESLNGFGFCCGFSERRGNELAAVIVRAGHEDFLPWFGMCRSQGVAIGEFVDLRRREACEEELRQIGEKRIAKAVDAFEMFEKEDQSFNVRCLQLAINAEKRMGDGVNEVSPLQELLEIENIIAKRDDFRVLRFGQAPHQEVNFARILREISRNLLANECVGQVRETQATVDRVVVGQRKEIHSRSLQLGVQLARIGVAVRKIEPPEEPFFRTVAVTRMEMEIALAHWY